ncbi:unnamed protein product [Cochlearia groenlandica]
MLHIFSYLPRNLNFIEHTSNIGWKEANKRRGMGQPPKNATNGDGSPFAREFQKDDMVLDKIEGELLGLAEGEQVLMAHEIVKSAVSSKRLEKVMVKLLDHNNFRAKQCV